MAAETGVGLVCMHAGHLPPRTDPRDPRYDDVMADVIGTVSDLAAAAVRAGVRHDGIVVDPGHDFGKVTVQSLEVTRRLPELVDTGWPVLVALSNKDFIGESLDLPTGERLVGTLAAASVSAWLGARLFRVHNVREVRQALDMVASIRGDRPPAVARRGVHAVDRPWLTAAGGRWCDRVPGAARTPPSSAGRWPGDSTAQPKRPEM